MAQVGNEKRPVFVSDNGEAKECGFDVQVVKIENQGDKDTIATITLDGVPYVLKNNKVGGKAYAVTFVNFDGAVLKRQAVKKGGTATAPADPTRFGYNFSGWSGNFTNVQKDEVVTATYTIAFRRVTFMAADGTTVVDTRDVQHGSKFSTMDKPYQPDISGYNKLGWGNPNPSSAIVNDQVLDHCSVYALYELQPYTVYESGWTKPTSLPAGTYQIVAVGGGGNSWSNVNYNGDHSFIAMGDGGGGSGACVVGTLVLTTTTEINITDGSMASNASLTGVGINVVAAGGSNAQSVWADYGQSSSATNPGGTAANCASTGLSGVSVYPGKDGYSGCRNYPPQWNGWPSKPAGSYATDTYKYGGGAAAKNTSYSPHTSYIRITRLA